MGLFFNNQNISPAQHVHLNNQSSQKVLHNNVLVWQRRPDFLFSNGDQAAEWTGGWAATRWYPFYGTPNGVPRMDVRNGLSVDFSGTTINIKSAAADYNGQGARPNNKIDFTNIASLTMSFQLAWPGAQYRWVNLTVGDEETFVQYQPGGIKTVGFNTQNQPVGTYSITLDTRDITGFHHVIASVSSGDSGSQFINVWSITVT